MKVALAMVPDRSRIARASPGPKKDMQSELC